MSTLTNLILGDTYEDALAQIGDAVTAVELDAVKALWNLGDLVVQFNEASKSRRFGKKTMQNLVDDLIAKGSLARVGNPLRHLHLARLVRENIPQEKIITYVRRGLGVTMVKRLAGLPPVVAKAVEDKLFADASALPSVRDFEVLVEDEIKLANARLVYPEAEPEELNAAVLAADRGQAPDSIKVEIVDSTSDEDLFGPAKTEGNPPLATPAPEPRQSPAKPEKAPKDKKDKGGIPDRPVSPMKALKVLDNAAQKITANIADALIAFKAVEKAGFDSKTARQNFEDCVNGTRASLKDALAVLPDFLKATSRD